MSSSVWPGMIIRPGPSAGAKKTARSTRKRKQSPMTNPFWHTQVFRFMDLPPELRELVYEEVFLRKSLRILRDGDSARARLPADEKKGGQSHGHPFLAPNGASLLCVSRQIHSEATPILYSKNTFEFPHALAVPPLLAQAQTYVPLLRNVDVVLGQIVAGMPELELLGACTGIHSMVLRCPITNSDRYYEILAKAIERVVRYRRPCEAWRAFFAKITLVDFDRHGDRLVASSSSSSAAHSDSERLQKLRKTLEARLGLI
ncbi:Hypothetical predicted protein [Lecanosticta acicola]|uniref:DUF7730 domain-containing protein n=1 Tax=Lecanosticta acicola TaxID=111012 RepID=A0AAI9E8F6_9PEZI|nr:Hypothetical predicted protein [Lecanosticta acicola]